MQPPANLTISPLTDATVLSQLAAEAMADGHRMVARLIDEWITGENRFDKPGEQSYLATLDGIVCGVCGLNIDPFAGNEKIGRVRRLYVARAFRRRGIGSALMQRLLTDARGRFSELQLRTHDPIACSFYEALGFIPVAGTTTCTHRRTLQSE
jgi:GNAT superfamily N-acetyltransferase